MKLTPKKVGILLSIAFGVSIIFWLLVLHFTVPGGVLNRLLSIKNLTQVETIEANKTQMLFFGYETNGLERSTIGEPPNKNLHITNYAERSIFWIAWHDDSKPWWKRFPIDGYAIVSGEIQFSSVPAFGNGFWTKQIANAHSVVPPLPIAFVYFIVSVLFNLTWLIITLRKGSAKEF